MSLSRRVRLIAFFLPVAGLVLIMPPVVFIFDRPMTILGIPGIIAFLFAIWFAMIIATFLLQRHLPRPPGETNGRD